MTIYLMVKTHNVTGLKYLCKTKRKDPYKYKGSGDYWIPHIKKHGYDVTTEILKECKTNEEIKHWGLYYSDLWDVVNARDDSGRKLWANLKPEAGDGLDSETSSSIQRTRVQDGTHHLLRRSDGTSHATDRAAEGTHPFQKRKDGTSVSSDRVVSGTHRFLGGDIQRRSNLNRAVNGIHPFQKRKDGTSLTSDRVLDGTNPFLGEGCNRKMLEAGTHPSQIKKTCEHCGKTVSSAMYTRWHGYRCRDKS